MVTCTCLQLPRWLSEGKGQPHTRCQHSDQNREDIVHRHTALELIIMCVGGGRG